MACVVYFDLFCIVGQFPCISRWVLYLVCLRFKFGGVIFGGSYKRRGLYSEELVFGWAYMRTWELMFGGS